MEAWGVSRLVTALNATLRSRSLNLAVITPYNAHKELIKKHLRTLQDPYVKLLFKLSRMLTSTHFGPHSLYTFSNQVL